MFRRGDDIGFRCIDDDDAAFRRTFDIDIVHSVAGTAHDFEVFGRIVQFFVDLGHTADDQGIVVPDDLHQFFPGNLKIDRYIQIRVLLQFRYAFIRNPLCNQYFLFIHFFFPPYR